MERKQKKELKVLKLINKNSNWEDILSSEPYNLIIKKKYPFILLKYNQLESDMANEIVQECRGLILKQIGVQQYKISSMRFYKFFNYGQKEAAKLEFPSEASEKIDGSLIGVWYDEVTGWHISTSGNIDAEDAPIGIGGINNYKELFDVAWGDLNFDVLNKNYTYMFELVSPYTRLIVPYKETELYLLAIRNNDTLEEVRRDALPNIAQKIFGDKIKIPKSFICNSIKEIQDFTESLTENNEHYEGFVLCDKNFNRIKLKSSTYANLFFIKGEGVFSDKKILKLIMDEKDDDILGHFPEYNDNFSRIRRGLSLFITHLKKILFQGKRFYHLEKKEFAQWAKECPYNNILFKAYGYDYWNRDDEFQALFLKKYVESIPISKLVEHIRGELENE